MACSSTLCEQKVTVIHIREVGLSSFRCAEIKFDYDPEVVKLIKKVPSCNRHYSSRKRSWEIDLWRLDQFVATVEYAGHKVMWWPGKLYELEHR
jgi:hypothetical protein